MSTRRPLKSRGTRWARTIAGGLARAGATPNGISIASVGFAALGGLAFWISGGDSWGWLLIAAFGIQMRLLCNLMDGMVAVEGGLGAPDGPFWNEVPDRVADVLILLGAGLAVGQPALGWAAGALAIGTAYLREFGVAQGLDPDFSGPFAKPHRMAAMTGTAILAAIWPSIAGAPVLALGLWIVTLGTAATSIRRAMRLLNNLADR